jgi:hypothetical protein
MGTGDSGLGGRMRSLGWRSFDIDDLDGMYFKDFKDLKIVF